VTMVYLREIFVMKYLFYQYQYQKSSQWTYVIASLEIIKKKRNFALICLIAKWLLLFFFYIKMLNSRCHLYIDSDNKHATVMNDIPLIHFFLQQCRIREGHKMLFFVIIISISFFFPFFSFTTNKNKTVWQVDTNEYFISSNVKIIRSTKTYLHIYTHASTYKMKRSHIIAWSIKLM
jgi:hypothetical protein